MVKSVILILNIQIWHGSMQLNKQLLEAELKTETLKHHKFGGRRQKPTVLIKQSTRKTYWLAVSVCMTHNAMVLTALQVFAKVKHQAYLVGHMKNAILVLAADLTSWANFLLQLDVCHFAQLVSYVMMTINVQWIIFAGMLMKMRC